jgi:AhpD family alkylhydroperoxidase
MYDLQNLERFGRFAELAPEAFKAFVAVAITTQCPCCIEIHAARAKQAGATGQELAETTLISAALRAGGAMTHGTHALT